jgi:riboflavin synthase
MPHVDHDTEFSTHEENAESIRHDLQRMARRIRGFTLLTTERRRRVVVSGHVDDDYLRNVALLLDQHPDLAITARLTAEEIRDHLRFSGAYQGVGEELILHGRKMTDTLINERASIGQRALHVHQISRTINHPPGTASVVPHLEALDREFTRGRRRRRPSGGELSGGERQGEPESAERAG